MALPASSSRVYGVHSTFTNRSNSAPPAALTCITTSSAAASSATRSACVCVGGIWAGWDERDCWQEGEEEEDGIRDGVIG